MNDDTLPQADTVFHVSAKICRDIGSLISEIESLFCSHNFLIEKSYRINPEIQKIDLAIQSIEELAKLLEKLGKNSDHQISYNFHFASESINLEWMKNIFLENMEGSKNYGINDTKSKIVLFDSDSDQL